MQNCPSCGVDVTGKKFCSGCGSEVRAVEAAAQTHCPQCAGVVKAGAAFCMHCGAALRSPQTAPVAQVAVMRSCPACYAQVGPEIAFCTNCGQTMRPSQPQAAPPVGLRCNACGQQNAPGVRFCGSCGGQLGVQQNYQVQPYAQQQYPQPNNQYNQYNQYNQGGYQPMIGQGPLMLRCPVCMAMAPMGTQACRSCHTSLAGVVPTPMNNAPMQGQQGGVGGFLQGDGGKYAIGALGGAAALLGAQSLLNGFEDRSEGDFGQHHHQHHDNDGGLLGGLGRMADDIGLI